MGPHGSAPDRASGPDEPLEQALARIEAAIHAGDTDLRALGFWRLVARLKRDRPEEIRLSEMVGRIDRKAFEARVRPRFSVQFGNAVLVASSLAAAAAVAVGFWLGGKGGAARTWGGLLAVGARWGSRRRSTTSPTGSRGGPRGSGSRPTS